MVWVGNTFQFDIEALIPINRQSGSKIGFIAQLHLPHAIAVSFNDQAKPPYLTSWNAHSIAPFRAWASKVVKQNAMSALPAGASVLGTETVLEGKKAHVLCRWPRVFASFESRGRSAAVLSSLSWFWTTDRHCDMIPAYRRDDEDVALAEA